MEIEKDEKLPDIKAICKKCDKPKVRNPAGFFGNGRDRRFVDGNKKIWCGKLCPDCQRLKMKNHQKIKRSKDIQ